MAEILEELEKVDDDVNGIFIEPPDPNMLSDEDSGNEDEGGAIDNLSSRQLAANAEVVFNNGGRLGYDVDLELPFDVLQQDIVSTISGEEIVTSELCDVPSILPDSVTILDCTDSPNTSKSVASTSNACISQNTERQFQSKKGSTVLTSQSVSKKPKVNKLSMKKTNDRQWKTTELSVPLAQPFPESNFSKYTDFSPVELFELFFDEQLFLLMVEQIKLYAAFKNVPDPNISQNDLKCFLGILTISGYNCLPGIRYYWDTSDDMRNHLIYKSMRRNRFIQIMSLLHFADNNKMDQRDKLWKLRPLIKILQSNFIKHFVPVQQLDYDESMIAYYGRHSCKQFIKGKPIRFGYKVWCLNTYSGYLLNFDVYQGKSKDDDIFDKSFGKAAAPMVRMLDELGPKKLFPYHIYFDNLFTGMNLLVYLRECNYHGTGTVRANRVPDNCNIISNKEITSKERGYNDYKVSNDNIIVARWKDNAPVTVASTVHGVAPFTSVKRYSKTEKKTVMVPRPALIGEYNKFMGGTDLMDENINRYRVSVRGKKWWWSIFSWCLDACFQNAWYIYNMSHSQKISQLDFKRDTAVHYLKTYGTEPQLGGRKASRPQSTPAFEELKFDKMEHYIIQNDGNKRRRCAGLNCSSSVRTSCTKCKVGLCIPCFMPFHTKI